MPAGRFLEATPSREEPEETTVATEETTQTTAPTTEAAEPEASTTEIKPTETKDKIPATAPEDNKNVQSASDSGTFFPKLWRFLAQILKWLLLIGTPSHCGSAAEAPCLSMEYKNRFSIRK